MAESTTNYDLFVCRQDNRNKIDHRHVNKIIQSIKGRNLLEFRPIMVNERMEIIDGQHRLLAAKQLGVAIYYEKQESLEPEDIISLNIAKAWSLTDFLNFYVKHEYPEYVKLDRFIKKNKISLKVATTLCMGQAHSGHDDFKIGKFIFVEETANADIDICWETVDYIKKMNGFSNWTSSVKFWKGMIKLFSHPDFDLERWRGNMRKLITQFTPRTSAKEYLTLVKTIYNYRHQSKIELYDERL